MTNITKAAQQALEALESLVHNTPYDGRYSDAIIHLRAALQDKAGEVREPTLWISQKDLDRLKVTTVFRPLVSTFKPLNDGEIPLFAAQPAPVVPDDHPLMIFAKECRLGAYMEHEVPLAARKAIAASQQKGATTSPSS